MKIHWLFSLLAIFVFLNSADAQVGLPNEANECSLPGGGTYTGQFMACRLAGIKSARQLASAINRACDNRCDQGATNAIRDLVDEIEVDATGKCPKAGSCSMDEITLVDNCITQLAAARKIANTLDEKRKNNAKCGGSS